MGTVSARISLISRHLVNPIGYINLDLNVLDARLPLWSIAVSEIQSKTSRRKRRPYLLNPINTQTVGCRQSNSGLVPLITMPALAWSLL